MARASKKAAGEKPPAAIVPRDRIIDALMALAAEERFEDITLKHIAERADVSLAEFRDHFGSRHAVLAAFGQRIDRVVLEGTSGDLDDESPKERLFDVLMRRFDALAPYRESLRGVSEWARREPLEAARLGRWTVQSMRFMLEAAGIDTGGRVGAIKARGLALGWANVARVWLEDEDTGLAQTMAELDRTLKRGGVILDRVKDVERLVSPLRAMARGVVDAGFSFARDRIGGARRRRDERDGEASTAANEI
jgi:AcrR family transcriptional regulator